MGIVKSIRNTTFRKSALQLTKVNNESEVELVDKYFEEYELMVSYQQLTKHSPPVPKTISDRTSHHIHRMHDADTNVVECKIIELKSQQRTTRKELKDIQDRYEELISLALTAKQEKEKQRHSAILSTEESNKERVRTFPTNQLGAEAKELELRTLRRLHSEQIKMLFKEDELNGLSNFISTQKGASIVISYYLDQIEEDTQNTQGYASKMKKLVEEVNKGSEMPLLRNIKEYDYSKPKTESEREEDTKDKDVYTTTLSGKVEEVKADPNGFFPLENCEKKLTINRQLNILAGASRFTVTKYGIAFVLSLVIEFVVLKFIFNSVLYMDTTHSSIAALFANVCVTGLEIIASKKMYYILKNEPL